MSHANQDDPQEPLTPGEGESAYDADAPEPDAPEDRVAEHESAEEAESVEPVESEGVPLTSSSRRNALGVWAVVTGALLLFPIALVLGHLGLRAHKQGEADNRSVALAGVILGYVGLLAALVTTALALFIVWPNATAQNADANAKIDVINMGNAAVAQTLDSGEMPSVSTADGAYAVGGSSVAAELDPAGEATIEGETPLRWCINLSLSYDDGNQSDVSYSSTGGLMEAANCG